MGGPLVGERRRRIVIRRLIKLQLKIALYPVKLALKAAGIIGDSPQTSSTYPPSSSDTGPDRYEPPPEPEVPQDIEIQAKDVLADIKEGNSVESLTQSKVVTQAMTDTCDMGNKGEGK